MPSRRRPYVPKRKVPAGCYQCARRRISCDRTEPQCLKCTWQGLHCTGLSLQLSLDGELHHQPDRVAQSPPQSRQGWSADANTQPSGNYSQRDGVIPVCEPGDKENGQHWSPLQEDAPSLEHLTITGLHRHADVSTDSFVGQDSEPDDDAETTYEKNSNTRISQPEKNDHRSIPCAGTDIYMPITDTIPAWKRRLCSHFSDRIATRMVAVDGQHNSWRHLIIPFACSSDHNLALDALLYVSSLHIDVSHSSMGDQSEARDWQSTDGLATLRHCPGGSKALYASILSRLRHFSGMHDCDTTRAQSILITIVVLLLGSMVTGESDFPFLYRMLNSAFDAAGGMSGLGNGEIAEFIQVYADRLRFYSTVLLDEKGGSQMICSPSHVTKLLNSLSHRMRDLPQHNEALDFVEDAVQQALHLYRKEALHTVVDEADTNTRVQRFIETRKHHSQYSQGACDQVLVWATFVVASASILDEHRRFFEHLFYDHHLQSGFRHVLFAPSVLRKIWAREPSVSWTSMLAQTEILIM